jgi:hypothetical protein
MQIQSIRGRDARTSDEKFDLDVHGFQWVKRKSVEKKFDDQERIKDVNVSDLELLNTDPIDGVTSVLARAIEVISTSHITRLQTLQQKGRRGLQR